MIRKTIIVLLLIFVQIGFAQIGIGTTTPTPGYSLDVDGSLLIQDEFKPGAFSNEGITNTDTEFLVRLLNSSPIGEVKRLDLSQLAVGPINIADYVFTNLSRDNVTAVDLQYDSTKYIVGLSNFQYTGENIIKGGSGYVDIGDFVTRTYVDPTKKTWHIEMRNRTRDAASNNAIVYNVTLIIYDKKYFKELPPKTVNFGGSQDGAVDFPPIEL